MTTISLRHIDPAQAAEIRRVIRMQVVDALPPEWRELVHDYGFGVVDSLRNCGVTKAKHGRHLVETILDELSPTRGTSSSQGTKPFGFVMVPREPTEAMIAASMATVTAADPIVGSKREKHVLRLRAALNAALEEQKRSSRKIHGRRS